MIFKFILGDQNLDKNSITIYSTYHIYGRTFCMI